jgi:hypothetical protein
MGKILKGQGLVSDETMSGRQVVPVGTHDQVPLASQRENLPVTALKGMFGKSKRVVSIAQMNTAIAECAAAASISKDSK